MRSLLLISLLETGEPRLSAWTVCVSVSRRHSIVTVYNIAYRCDKCKASACFFLLGAFAHAQLLRFPASQLSLPALSGASSR